MAKSTQKVLKLCMGEGQSRIYPIFYLLLVITDIA